MKGQLLINQFLAQPWAIMPDVLSAHATVVAAWAAGEPMAYDDDSIGGERISAFEARRREAQSRVGGNGIAVIPIFGTIVQRAGMMTEWCGGSSTMQLSQALSSALADRDVGQILLEIDSPGGSVFGVQELADQIYAAREQKPIIAHANSLSASAAYWLGSQANEFYAAPGAMVGSIGVYTAHDDISAALAEKGIKRTFISAGKYKVEGNSYEPLSDEAKAFMASQINDYYGQFTGSVARGRGTSATTVRSGMGQGRVLGSEAALAENMIDGIVPLSQLIKQKAGNASAAVPRRASARARAERELALLN